MNHHHYKNIEERIQRIQNEEAQSSSASWSAKYLLGLLIVLVLGSYAFYNKKEQSIVSIAADKMNVLYIGLNNPITVAASGITPERLKLSSEALELIERKPGHYFAHANKPGKAIIQVKAEGMETQDIEFRVKRVPDPIAKFAKSSGGNIAVEVMKQNDRVEAVLEKFEYDAACLIEEYVLTLVPKGEDPIEARNTGAVFQNHTQDILRNVKAKDIIYIDNVKCKCPGDAAARSINAMVFRIR